MLGVRTFHFLMDAVKEKKNKKKGQKDRKRANRKVTKGLIGHAGRSQTVAGQFTYAGTHTQE